MTFCDRYALPQHFRRSRTGIGFTITVTTTGRFTQIASDMFGMPPLQSLAASALVVSVPVPRKELRDVQT